MFPPRMLIAGLLLTLGLVSDAWSQADEPPELSVTGSGEVRIVPDQVTLRFGIESRAETLDAAYQDNEQRVRRIVERLGELDIDRKNIRTDMLKIQPLPPQPAGYGKAQQAAKLGGGHDDPFAMMPQQSEARQKTGEIQPAGFTVQRNMQVVLGRLELFDEVYRSLVERGITKLDSIRFSSTSIDDVRRQARVAAIRSARSKAETLAGELGLKPVGVKTITESRAGSSRHDDPFGGMDELFGARDRDSTNLFAGELTVAEHVHVVFLLDRAEIAADSEE